MVSKKLIKSYDFDTIEDYFNYIVDSKINGNRQQAQELYNNLSARQKDSFQRWFLEYYYYDAVDNNTTSERQYLDFMNYLRP